MLPGQHVNQIVATIFEWQKNKKTTNAVTNGGSIAMPMPMRVGKGEREPATCRETSPVQTRRAQTSPDEPRQFEAELKSNRIASKRRQSIMLSALCPLPTAYCPPPTQEELSRSRRSGSNKWKFRCERHRMRMNGECAQCGLLESSLHPSCPPP